MVTNEDAIKKHGFKPLARIVGWHVVGVDPSIMGIGPVPAIKGLLQKTKLKMNDIDLFEVCATRFRCAVSESLKILTC